MLHKDFDSDQNFHTRIHTYVWILFTDTRFHEFPFRKRQLHHIISRTAALPNHCSIMFINSTTYRESNTENYYWQSSTQTHTHTQLHLSICVRSHTPFKYGAMIKCEEKAFKCGSFPRVFPSAVNNVFSCGIFRQDRGRRAKNTPPKRSFLFFSRGRARTQTDEGNKRKTTPPHRRVHARVCRHSYKQITDEETSLFFFHHRFEILARFITHGRASGLWPQHVTEKPEYFPGKVEQGIITLYYRGKAGRRTAT